MSNISQIVLNTMLYQMNNSNNSSSTSNTESFSKLLQTSLMSSLTSSSSSGCSCSSSGGISSLGMIVTLTGLLNQNKLYESTSSTNNELDSNSQATEIDNQNSNVSSNTSISNSTTSTNSDMDKAINLLKQQLGKPYVWGDEGPDSFDCSGLVQYIYKNALGINLPRVSYDQSKVGQAVSREDLQVGDLVFFDTMNKGRVSHVGIYIGNNEFIHAANSKKGVIKSSLTGYYDKKFVNARRP